MSLISMVIASVAVLIVLMISYAYMYATERKSFILVWLFSLSAFLAAYLLRIVMIVSGRESTLMLLLNFTSTTFGHWLIYKGSCLFFKRKQNPIFGACSLFLASAYYIALVTDSNPQAILSAAAVLSAAVLSSAGYISLTSAKIKGTAKKFLGLAFFTWGAAALIYPFSRILEYIPLQYAYIAVGVTGLITTLSIQAAYFISIREEMQSKEEKIRKLVIYDKLTGVYNRTYFEEISGDICGRFTLPAAFAMADINGLKLINDTFGHKQGDELLVTATGIMKESVDESNTIIRWGGDEFIIIMPGSTMADAEKVVKKIKDNCRFYHSKTIPLDISIGLSIIDSCACNINDILRQAEERMYSGKLLESRQTRRDIIDFLQKILWEKDYQTEEHVMRLKGMTFSIGKRLGLSSKETDDLTQVALLHDIGKIAVPVGILKKQGPLTQDEWCIMKKHSETGYRIAQSSHELAHISEAILGHHEWWNGSGYPQGLRGEEIPLYSRIVSIVDSFDVMTHDRPYKQAVGSAAALEEIKRCAGSQYDPSLVEVFIDLMAG